MCSANNLPVYMRNLDEDISHYYGKLKYDRKTDSWVIHGEPVVCQYAKRLFPGSSGRGSGVARFKNNKRNIEDLKWLMSRFPLEISDSSLSEWEISESLAMEHVVKKIEVLNKPKKENSGDWFTGELKEFQKEGLSFLLNYSPCLLADEMGLGKTIQALAWISKLKNKDKGIIVLPKNIVNQWKESILKFTKTSEDEIHIVKGLTPYDISEDVKIVLIHYGLLRGWKTELPRYGFDFLVFDEIQELRHKGTEKYSSASLLAESVDNRIGMSGTPIYNVGGEIWNILNIIEYHCIGDWDSFTREWCSGYGSDVVSKPVLLGDYLKREGLMIRRTKREVIKELPEKRRVVFEIDGDDRLFNKEIQNALTLIRELDETTDNLKIGRLKRLIDTETRKATGISKAKDVSDFVKMLLESGESVVLYGWHHAVYDIWKESLKSYNPLMITGRESDAEKIRNKNLFSEGKAKLLIISLRAAAGLDGLQNISSINVFGELDWSPGVHSQCEDRLHRIGQEDSVLSYYPLASSGSDEEIMDHLGFKTSQFAGIMGDRVESQEDKMLAQSAAGKHINNVIEKLKGKIV